MVTLNGRQMPAADAFGDGDCDHRRRGGNTRSFNFANLAAEAISAVEVYKTGRADIATGGIGASINMRTARPLDNDGLVLNVGAKALNDTHQSRRQRLHSGSLGHLQLCQRRTRRSASACRPATRSVTAVRHVHRQRLAHPAVGRGQHGEQLHAGSAVRSRTRPIRTMTCVDLVRRECAGQRPALRHPERHPLRVLGLRA